ncbi:Hypothetical protein R9X50_00236500 [Acrodontium crateriforme]|uniref:5-formyltetrahydrofolate cyclo-ligase n=1 Tax=Acrodontium crateriforme TaxID=150365 RepID=A0AAQ3R6K7_9PEZI|nr:Hypothetical protein R9X50_00236500 [Acrodontium crateriforme]
MQKFAGPIFQRAALFGQSRHFLHKRLWLQPSNRTMSTEGKKALRSNIRATLSQLKDEEITRQSQSAQELVFALPQYKAAQHISIYLAMPTAEARTDGLVRHSLESGKSVYVPYLATISTKQGQKSAKKEMQMLQLHSQDEYNGLERDSWGIPSLPSGDGRANAMDSDAGLDMIIVPGVAFDGQMNRIGHGAGFYDRFLTKFCADGTRQKPYLVGFCLSDQILASDQIKMESWDWKVDTVVVGDGRRLTFGSS